MRSKAIISAVLLYLASFIAGTALFVGLFHTGLFRSMDVLFYRGIALLVITCAVMSVFLIVIRISWKDIYMIVLTIFAVNMLFFTHVPVTAERSISIFLLGYMNTKNVVTKEELTNVFLDKYMNSEDNIGKRIHEQEVTGDIVQVQNGYLLTPRGKLLMQFYNVIADIFGINKQLIAPK